MIEEKDNWYMPRGIIELLPLRQEFFKVMAFTEDNTIQCTCDTCLDVTRCSCAYDSYNTNGDCLLK